ncbi:MAG: alkaline phosphatase PhoX [Bacteroidota bacterium]
MRLLYLSLFFIGFALPQVQAQLVFPDEIEIPEGYAPQTVLMPGSPLTLQVLFVGGTDLVQTTPTYGNPAGQAIAKEWHDFAGFTPDETGESLGWVSVNHEMIYRDNRIGDGGGMTAFRVERDPITGLLNVMDQTLSDGRSGQFFNVDFVNTVGETGMNCGGISSVVDGRIWTAEEWFRSSNGSINDGRFSTNALSSGPWGTGERANQGVRDTAEWTISAPDFPAFDGLTVPKYENFNWMVEIDPREAVAIRKQYNMGRQGFEGGAVSLDNRTMYLGVDATPAFWVKFVADEPGDFTQGKTYVYKHDAPEKWLEIDNADAAKMLNFADEAVALEATMYNRIEWVTIDPQTGIIYMTETGRDTPGSNWEDEAAEGAVFAPHHLARAADQGLTEPNDNDTYWDYYGRVLKYDPATEEITVMVEGGPYFEVSPMEADYPEKHLSNPDGLSQIVIDGRTFLVIQEDLNGDNFGRMPFENDNANGGLGNRMCELYLLDATIEDATIDDLIRLTVVPLGAEVTGAVPTPDGKSLIVNSQHPSGANPFPWNHSLTFAIHGFDQLTVTGLNDPDIDDQRGFSIYPNPTLQNVHLNTVQDVALYTQMGQLLQVYRNVDQINVSHLPAGIYYLRSNEGAVIQLVKE